MRRVGVHRLEGCGLTRVSKGVEKASQHGCHVNVGKNCGRSGDARCGKLLAAAKQGAVSAPVDLRYLRKPYDDKDKDVNKRADVISFLETLYNSIAEVVPDIRDSTFDGINPEDVPESGLLTDTYAIELNKQVSNPDAEKKWQAAPKAVVEKPRKMRRSIVMNEERKPGDSEHGFEVRKLPPGCMKEHYEQYKLSSSQPASFPTFWRAPCQFGKL